MGPQPVVHFEIIGTDPARLRDYYGTLFGWEFDTTGPVPEKVSRQGEYGYTQPPDSIPGGVGGGAGFDSHVVFYVGVSDVEAALRKAESLGGKRAMGSRAPPGRSPRGRPLHRPRGQPDRPRRPGLIY